VPNIKEKKIRFFFYLFIQNLNTCGDESSSLSSYIPGDVLVRGGGGGAGKFVAARCSFKPGNSDEGI
jgi:hypothetical protein